MDENEQSLLEWLRKNCPQLLSKALLDQQFLSLLTTNNRNDTKNASTDGVIHRNHSNGTRNRTKEMANASSTAKITQSSTPSSLEMSESMFSSTIIPDPQKHQQQNRITTMWMHQPEKLDSNFMANRNYNNGQDEDGNDQNMIVFDGHKPISLSEFRLNGFQTDDPNNLIKVTTSDNEMTSSGSGSMIMVNHESPLSQAHIIQSHSDSSRNAFIYVMVILTIYLMAVACIAIQYYRKHQTLDPFSAYMLGKNTKRAKEHRARHYRRKQQVPSKHKPQPQTSNTSPLPSPSQTSSSSSNHNHLQHHLHHHAHLHCHDIGHCPRKTTSSLLHHLNSSPNLSTNPSPPLLTCSFSASTFDPREDDSTPTSHIPDQLDHRNHKPTCTTIMNPGPDLEPMDDDYNDERLQQSRCVSNPAKHHHHPHLLVNNQNPNNTTMIKCHHLKSKVSSNSATSAQLNSIFMDSCSPDAGSGHGSSNFNDGCHGFSNQINNNTNNNKNKMGDLHTSNDVCQNETMANILLDNNNHNDNNNEYNESLNQIQINIEQCGTTNKNLNQNGTQVKPETMETKSNLPIYKNERIIDNESFYEEEDDDFEPETENDDDDEEEEEEDEVEEEEEEEEEEDHEVDDEYDTPDIIITTSSTNNQQESRPKMAQIPRAIRLKNFFSFGSYSGATTINTNTANTANSYTPPPTVPLTYNASHTLDQATVPLPEVASKSKPPPLKFLMRSLSLRTSFDSSSSTSTTNITNTDIFSSSNIDHHHALQQNYHHVGGDRQPTTASAKMVRFQTRRSSSSVIHSPYGSQITCQATSGSVSSGSGGLGSARYEETHL